MQYSARMEPRRGAMLESLGRAVRARRAGAGLTLLDPARATRWFTLSANLMLLGAFYYGWVRARSEGQPGATDP